MDDITTHDLPYWNVYSETYCSYVVLIYQTQSDS